jgi:hypothetical protein
MSEQNERSTEKAQAATSATARTPTTWVRRAGHSEPRCAATGEIAWTPTTWVIKHDDFHATMHSDGNGGFSFSVYSVAYQAHISPKYCWASSPEDALRKVLEMVDQLDDRGGLHRGHWVSIDGQNWKHERVGAHIQLASHSDGKEWFWSHLKSGARGACASLDEAMEQCGRVIESLSWMEQR